MCGVSHGSFSLHDHLDPLQQAGQSEAEGRVGKTGGWAETQECGYDAPEEAPFFRNSTPQNLKCWPGRPEAVLMQYSRSLSLIAAWPEDNARKGSLMTATQQGTGVLYGLTASR